MNTKQKKTLLGAMVALILVGTIVLTALGVSGYLSPGTTKPTKPKATSLGPPEMNLDELMEKLQSDNVKAKHYKHLYVAVTAELRTALTEGGFNAVEKHEEAQEHKVKEVAMYGSHFALKDGDKIDEKIEEMDGIGKVKVVEPKWVPLWRQAVFHRLYGIPGMDCFHDLKHHLPRKMKEDADDWLWYRELIQKHQPPPGGAPAKPASAALRDVAATKASKRTNSAM